MRKDDILNIERSLAKVKPTLLKALRKEGADVLVHVVRNSDMENIRQALLERKDFIGREARKISAEEQINVLAFQEPSKFPHPESTKVLLGEIYLNYDFEKNKDRYAVLAPLFIHGLLHLLGYEHWTNRDTIRMQALEKKLWEEHELQFYRRS
jgi:rRNA maturation RNase YbeY